ncbi:pentapeptide repeat-containing protein [Hahella ganghwensis]|uniref:pentapeptide repeat-containing protein n=1 Tax=Hahella ganghwensis TaxID=286420 RepID=UPI00039D8299|nr:pentapeptide repeat-containing protein [Hahella ganghwensis]
MEKVKIIDHPMYQLLRDEKIEEFNTRKGQGEAAPSFELCDFRGLDLRGLDAHGLDLRGAYFRGADLRGINFEDTLMEGASIAATKISGCLFPKALPADEIIMSLTHGTRMRYFP